MLGWRSPWTLIYRGKIKNKLKLMMASKDISLSVRRIVVGFIRESPCKAETSWTKAERSKPSKANSCGPTVHGSSWSLEK